MNATAPRLLFFSGGSGLRATSRALVERGEHSAHLVTPFDSGGSSAVLREAFAMPAVGDLRNRLVALIDPGSSGGAQARALLGFRFPDSAPPGQLVSRLGRMVSGEDPLTAGLSAGLEEVVRAGLTAFHEAMPRGFDLRNAAVGNLVLTGLYFEHGRRLVPAAAALSKSAAVRGVVRPVIDADLHLAANLDDGTTVVGQHLLTGRSVPPLGSPVARLRLCDREGAEPGDNLRVDAEVETLVARAGLLCFPVGSFYTSLVATLLPSGVADAVAGADAPKVYVPNAGGDPEEMGMTLADKVATLVRYLREGCARPVGVGDVLTHVLVDRRLAAREAEALRAVERMGIEVVTAPLEERADPGEYEGGRLAEALLALAQSR